MGTSNQLQISLVDRLWQLSPGNSDWESADSVADFCLGATDSAVDNCNGHPSPQVHSKTQGILREQTWSVHSIWLC